MNYYEVLGIKKTATQNEIKSAYKKLVKKYHPDIYPGDKSYAELKIKEINNAYDVLSNLEFKKEYDETLTQDQIYSYTPPTYNNTNSSPYSYNNYKNSSYYKQNTYSKTSHYNYTNQYQNTTSYYSNDTQKRYTDYHRSKTPNSNYSNNNSNDFTNNIMNNFDKMSPNGKIVFIFFIIIFYLIFVLINIFQLSKLLSTDSNTIKKTTYIQNQTIEKDYHTNTNTLDNFNINDYFSESQLLDVYNSYYKDKYTYKEFKNIISEAYKDSYYLK